MTTARRTLNVVAAPLLLAAAVGLVVLLLSEQPRSVVPLSFLGLFAGAPALAHLAAAALAWRAVPLSRSLAVWGLACSCISCFVWVVLGATLAELASRRAGIASDWPLVTLFTAMFALPVSSATNLAYFRKVLLATHANEA